MNWRQYQQNIRQEFEDLGFGTRVGGKTSFYRLLNKDGSFNVKRRGLSFLESLTLYQFMLQISWPRFYLITLASYLLTNALFAVGYLLMGPHALHGIESTGVPNAFFNAFFFSVQAFTTVGFGQLTPVGMGPNLLFTIESLLGLIGFALITGFMFARFSRPHAKIAFSENAIISPYKAGRALMFRIANKHKGQLIELSAKVFISYLQSGHRSYHQVKLERSEVTFFPLHWTIVHPIQNDSPLWKKSPEELKEKDAEILILLKGYAETFAQTVHTRSSYKVSELEWGAKFADIYELLDDGRLSIDMNRLNEFEPAALPDWDES